MTTLELNMGEATSYSHTSEKSNEIESSLDEEEVLGTSGLYNMGNTCYMNSIVQCLSNCEVFRQYILSKNLIPDLLKNKEIHPDLLLSNIDTFLSFQLRKIIINIWNSSFYAFRPISFKKLFGKKIEMFQNSAQHDSQEALLCILDTFNEEIGNEIFIKSKNKTIEEDKFNFLLNQDELDDEQTHHLTELIRHNEEDYINYVSRENFLGFYKKKYSVICDIFGGRIISELKCPITDISKVNFEPFFFLSLSIPNDGGEVEDDQDSSSNDLYDDEASVNENTHSSDEEESVKESTHSSDKHSVNENTHSSDDEESVKESTHSSDEDNDDDDDSISPILNQVKQFTGSNLDEDGYFDEDSNSETRSDDESKRSSNTKSIDESDDESDDDTDYLNMFKTKYSSNLINHKTKKLQEYNLEDCLDKYFKPEILDDDNRWFSPYAKQKVNAVKNIMLWESPKILIIHLKRFKKTMYGTAEKITNKINFPLEGLDITKYYHSSSKCKNNVYDLFAINNHTNFNKFGFSGISFGHYYSYCKNITNNKWYEYNDEAVNEKDIEDIITSDAYILFYKLRE